LNKKTKFFLYSSFFFFHLLTALVVFLIFTKYKATPEKVKESPNLPSLQEEKKVEHKEN